MTLRSSHVVHDLASAPAAIVVMLAIALVFAGCGGGGAATAPTAPTPTAPASTASASTVPMTVSGSAPTTTTATTSVPAVRSDIDARVAFVVAALDDPTIVTDAAIAEQFAPAFIDAVGAAVIRSTITDLAAGSTPPWSVRDVETLGLVAVATLVDSAGTASTLQIEVEAASPGRITSAQLQAGSMTAITDGFADPGTRDEIDAALSALADRVVYGVYDTAGDGCTRLSGRDAGTAVPTGSTFKLWVLAALARAIEAGEATWDETVVVDAAHRSSPDGEVYQRPDGSVITLRELAELMISLSDNTATDLLIGRLGRAAIERTMVDIGVSTADRNTPFLTTADLFRLKFVDPALGERFLALDGPDGRRAFLEGEVASTPLPWLADGTWSGGAALDMPTRIDEIEWFATPADVCLTFQDLDRLAREPGLEHVGEILAMNPGLPFPAGQWSTIRFKGGSEPGVIMFAYWLEAPSGDRRVVVVSLTDPRRTIGDLAAAAAVARLLGAVAADL